MQEVFEFLKKCGVYYLATVEGDQIQVPFTGESGLTELKIYEYWESDGGWADTDEIEVIGADVAITTAGKAFWFVCSNPEETSFTEVSPLAE